MKEDVNEPVGDENNVPLFLGMDRSQLGVVLVLAKCAEQMKDLVESDLMQSAFEKLRQDYQDKSIQEQLDYVRSLHGACNSALAAGVLALNIISSAEQNITNAIIAQKNIERISE